MFATSYCISQVPNPKSKLLRSQPQANTLCLNGEPEFRVFYVCVKPDLAYSVSRNFESPNFQETPSRSPSKLGVKELPTPYKPCTLSRVRITPNRSPAPADLRCTALCLRVSASGSEVDGMRFWSGLQCFGALACNYDWQLPLSYMRRYPRTFELVCWPSVLKAERFPVLQNRCRGKLPESEDPRTPKPTRRKAQEQVLT